MITGGAYFRCLGGFDDTTAVATFPENCLRLFKDGSGLDGLDQFVVAAFVPFFDFRDLFEGP